MGLRWKTCGRALGALGMILSPLLVVWGGVHAAASGPREGHFAAPDEPQPVAFVVTGASSFSPGYYQTSEYLIGSVAVGLILPESEGTLDAELSDWTPEQRRQVLDEVGQGLEWWARQLPEARLTFVIDDHAGQPISTAYEPIRHPQYEEGLWISDVLSRLGYANGSHWTRVRAYLNDLRERHHTDWAFAVFVVNSQGDVDAAFADGYFAYAYVGGPFFVMTYNNAGYGIANMDAVAAHETGHIFRALDQYAGANTACTARSGYLDVETQNSQRPGCASDVPSIMRGGIAPYLSGAIDPYARGQVGWRDSDSDGLPDPIDTQPALAVDSATGFGGAWQYAGRASDVPYPSPLRPAVTISDVWVEYRIDGGEWTQATAADGRFDSPDEAFTLTLNLARSGNHRLGLRARNSAGNNSDVRSFVVVVPDPIDGGLDTWLAPKPVAAGGHSAPGIASSFHVDGTPGVAIARVEYRIDGGHWQPASADDGAFDSAEESFQIPLDGAPHGTYRIEARAFDASGRVEQNLAELHVNGGYAIFIPIVQK